MPLSIHISAIHSFFYVLSIRTGAGARVFSYDFRNKIIIIIQKGLGYGPIELRLDKHFVERKQLL